MSDLVPADEIELIVGMERHRRWHYARAVSSEQVLYILHSHACKSSGVDLRECRFSRALDQGIHEADWMAHEDKAVRVAITRSGILVPVVPGMRLAR